MSSATVLDLRGVPCPLNLVRSRLLLQKLPPGSLVELWLDEGDPITQVPPGLIAAGHRLGTQTVMADGYVIVQVERQS